MDISEIRIREMENGEQKTIVKIGKKAFSLFEGIFIGKPKQAIVAEYKGEIIGSIIYKSLSIRRKKVVYIDEAFIDVNYQGLGIGRKLYKETFEYLWEQGCDVITAFVRDENVGSWKLLTDNGFQRVSLCEVKKQIGILGLWNHFVKTPFPFAVGMDFYMVSREGSVREKRDSIFSVPAVNFLWMLPLWIRFLCTSKEKLLPFLLAYLVVLFFFLGFRYLGNFFNKDKWKFRLNNGGSLIILLLSFWGVGFPFNANWYPDQYEKTNEFKRRLAIPEFVKWTGFSFLALLILTQNPFFKLVGEISGYYLLLMSIPFYPFESFGGGRIYRYNKKVWFIIFLISVIECILL